MVSVNDSNKEEIRRRRDTDSREQRTVAELDDMTLQVLRKYRKRLESSGYNSLPELWQDLAVLIDVSVQLASAQAVQRLLSLTSYFYEFCHGYRADTEQEEYKEYFKHLEDAWIQLFEQQQIAMTDRIRALNVLRDGNQLAADEFGVQNALDRALDAGLVPE